MRRAASVILFITLSALAANRWTIQPDGSLLWTLPATPTAPHQDHIEMSGRRVSLIARYGVDATGRFTLERQLVFPLLRTLPNDTHASLSYTFADDALPRILIDGRPTTTGATRTVRLHGVLAADSTLARRQDIALTRTIFPSTTGPYALERLTFTNHSDKPVAIAVEATVKAARTIASRGLDGEYIITSTVLNPGERTLAPNAVMTFDLAFAGRKSTDPEPAIDAAREEQARRDLVSSYLSKLQLETPNPVLNTAFAFAKIRTTESIYETKGGLMHGPGGGAYYAAIWANDQAEYANPFFPYLGDDTANASAMNAWRLFASYMNPGYKPIPSSIIAEGTSFWNGAGDRGDMAMIAYGASRFALAYGDRAAAEKLWPLIEWCLEYCRCKLTPDGIVASDSDELEGRFPAGKANLNTSSLYFDALRSASKLGAELGHYTRAYTAQADTLRAAINRYFGANVEGFETYRYYDGNTVLRAWICTPLTVGLDERARGTIEALFSPRLWTADGLASQAGDKTFWDRATLYALRGVLAAGETERAIQYLERYSERRLLGEHVPYPVEAWPEGNQRHLAAESALYCRIYLEGLFGIRPEGLRKVTLTPRLPAAWEHMTLRHIRAFQHDFDIEVRRSDGGFDIRVTEGARTLLTRAALKPGDRLTVELP